MTKLSEMESSRPRPWPRGSSRPANGVLGLETVVLGLGLEGQVLGLEGQVIGLGLGLEGQVLGLGLACRGLDSKSENCISLSTTALSQHHYHQQTQDYKYYLTKMHY